MVTTTLAAVALAGALSVGAKPSPSWQTDYAHAMSAASAERKPIAIFIGSSAKKPGKMIDDGTIPESAAQLLRESYVCLFVDTDTEAGKDLSSKFEIAEGLVISSPGGNVQALRHIGAVGGTELSRQLGQFATAGQPTTTVTTGIRPVVAGTSQIIMSGNCAGGNCYASYPSGTYLTQPTAGQVIGGTVVYPAGYSANPFGSSCPNGRCPNQR
ncbi:MAG: thioredoxin family protein [Planctomycetes bacterium]|nr:thioredoxin family protein [Planctomycetota bacterium]